MRSVLLVLVIAALVALNAYQFVTRTPPSDQDTIDRLHTKDHVLAELRAYARSSPSAAT